MATGVTSVSDLAMPDSTGNSAANMRQQSYTTSTVISKDGTTIGYRIFGHGPGLVLVQGTMGTAQDFLELAEALAPDFTVYVPDRRGRGISGPTGNNYSIQREVEDIEAVLTQTDSHNVFGLSSGGLISLTAALSLSAIHKLAVYDPVIFLEGVPTDKLHRFDQEMAEGKIAAALVTAMQAARLGPPIFDYLPRWLLEWMTGMMVAQQDKKGAGEYSTMRELAQQTLPNDFKIVTEMDGKMERFAAITTKVLLLGGTESPQFLIKALDKLEQILPNATRIEFDKLGHGAAWNADKRGQAATVAQALRTYFLNG